MMSSSFLYIPDNSKRRRTMTALDRIATFGAGNSRESWSTTPSTKPFDLLRPFAFFARNPR
jgi:hypothetical protein